MVTDRDGLLVELVSALERFARLVHSTSFTNELASVQWSALRFLSRSQPEHRTQGHLAGFSGVAPSSASRTVAALARKGLITVRRSGPGRQTRIELTDAGRSMLNRDPLRGLARVLETLEEGEKRHLLARFDEIAAAMLSASDPA
jgi:DNA-binding MarR family transcriptional regulator